MERYVKDGKFAVLVSHGYTGWSTNNFTDPELAKVMALHRKVVEYFINNPDNYSGIKKIIRSIVGVKEWASFSAHEDLVVEWLPINTKFRILGSDNGYETVELEKEVEWW